MEDSFEVRVKRLFGSQLFETVPRSSFPTSSWSVVDGEVERREWNRERGLDVDRSEDPCSSAFTKGGCFAKKRCTRKSSAEDFDFDVDEIDDDNDDVEAQRDERKEDDEDRVGDDNGEELEIRSSIGLDPTLDNEDEEDEFDRAAVGRDASAERLYMSDIKNHGPHLNYHNIFADVEDVPYDVSHCFRKDPRADHLAAGMRIEEDNKSAESIPMSSFTKAEVYVEDTKLKPILKRKELLDDSRPKKRVRFDNVPDELSSAAVDPSSVMFHESPSLPDYIKNPSKYTRYSFDDYEDNDFSNKAAFDDFQSLLHKNSNIEELQQCMDDELPKSITFKHRRKLIEIMTVCNDSRDIRESDLGMVRSTGIAAGESIEVGVSKIDEDDLEESFMDTEISVENERVGSSRRGRQYRSMASSDV